MFVSNDRRSSAAWLKIMILVVFCLASTVSGCACPPPCPPLKEFVPTGTIPRIPGYDSSKNNTVEYYTAGTATEGTKANFTLAFRNNDMTSVSFVVCAMMDLREGIDDPIHTQYQISWDSTNEEWTCQECETISGVTWDDRMDPSVHLGCTRVTISPGVVVTAFNEEVAFDRDVVQGDVKRYYFDLLRDGSINVDCYSVVGQNNNLAPENSGLGTQDFANVWAGHVSMAMFPKPTGPVQPTVSLLREQIAIPDSQGDVCYEAPRLDAPGLSRAFWDSGNWVTMGYPDTYPSRLNGSLTDAPPGSQVFLLFDDVLTKTYTVVADTTGPMCSSVPLIIDEPYTIGPQGGITELQVVLADSTCGSLTSGQSMRFKGTVFAEPGGPYYNAGDEMHYVDVLFVHDNEKPEYVLAEVTEEGNDLLVEIIGGDLVYPPTSALLRWDVGGAVTTEFIQFDTLTTLPLFPKLKSFRETVSGLPTGIPINYTLEIRDEFGNAQTLPPSSITLGGGSR